MKEKKESEKKTEYFHKNVNLTLLLFIVFMVLAITGVSVYFQNVFSKINADYNSKLDALNKVSGELKEKKELLNTTSSALELKEKKEEEISSEYTILKRLRDNLQIERDNFEDALKKTQAELKDKEQNLTAALETNKLLKKRIKLLENRVDSLEEQLEGSTSGS